MPTRAARIAMAEALLSPSVTRRVIQELARQQRYVPVVGPEPPHPAGAGGAAPGRSGVSNAEIAATLYLSEATVRTHTSNVLAKLGPRDRVQAVIFAYKQNIIDA